MVLAAARHERQNGLDILIESFPEVLRRLPNARLLIAGREGNQTSALHYSVHRLGMGDVVRFMGQRATCRICYVPQTRSFYPHAGRDWAAFYWRQRPSNPPSLQRTSPLLRKLWRMESMRGSSNLAVGKRSPIRS